MADATETFETLATTIRDSIYAHDAVAQAWGIGRQVDADTYTVSVTWTYLTDAGDTDAIGYGLAESGMWHAPEGFEIATSGPEDARGNGRGTGQWVQYRRAT